MTKRLDAYMKKCRFYQQDFWQKFIARREPIKRAVFCHIIRLSDAFPEPVFGRDSSSFKEEHDDDDGDDGDIDDNLIAIEDNDDEEDSDDEDDSDTGPNKLSFFLEHVLKKHFDVPAGLSDYVERLKVLKGRLNDFANQRKEDEQEFSDNLVDASYKFSTLYSRRFAYAKMFKTFYSNIDHKQFFRICSTIKKQRFNVVKFFLLILESRIDTFLFRTGLFRTFFEIRQLINHGFIFVNDRKINKPMFSLKFGDLLSIRTFNNFIFYDYYVTKLYNVAFYQLRYGFLPSLPSYIEFNYRTMSGVFLFQPTEEDVPYTFPVQFDTVINFYI
jgi:ribosomal protein S4